MSLASATKGRTSCHYYCAFQFRIACLLNRILALTLLIVMYFESTLSDPLCQLPGSILLSTLTNHRYLTSSLHLIDAARRDDSRSTLSAFLPPLQAKIILLTIEYSYLDCSSRTKSQYSTSSLHPIDRAKSDDSKSTLIVFLPPLQAKISIYVCIRNYCD